MVVGRRSDTAALLNNGKVLIIGGENSTGSPIASAELYDPATGAFTATGSMTTSRRWQTANLLTNAQVLIAGGGNLVCCLASAAMTMEADSVRQSPPQIFHLFTDLARSGFLKEQTDKDACD
jgi:hypothetical protein